MTQAVDLAQVTYQVKDLDLMERFLQDFGLITHAKEDDRLYMRGVGEQHHIHVTQRGEQQKFIGATFQMASMEALEALAKQENLPIEDSTEPGGGKVVTMRMPDGFEMRAIYGRKSAEKLPLRAPHPFNAGTEKKRVNFALRTPTAPCEVLRLGHFVLHVSNHDESVEWLSSRFGMIASDYFVPPGEEGPIVGTFLRFGLGEEVVDHHALLVLQSDWIGVHHCAFEVQDLDSIMTAHDYLIEQNWHLECGVGRHYMGSQIFDYWRDPFGFRIEHYTDGDVVNHKHVAKRFNGTASDTTQWGMKPPLEFFE